MIRSRLAILVLVGLTAAACSAGASVSAPASSAPSGADQGTRVSVTLTDALRMEPAEIVVPVGEVTFVVTNTGAIEHEFLVGDEATQAEHESEMASMPSMGALENGISVKPGETGELTMTFDAPGTSIAGCHVPGHYGGGMKATIIIGS